MPALYRAPLAGCRRDTYIRLTTGMGCGDMESGIDDAVRKACLWLPEAEEFVSHGTANFRVRGKTFATYVVNHHGDGRVALWLAAAPGIQEARISADPLHYFRPPYVGGRGWLGVHLDKGLAWSQIGALTHAAYAHVAPAALGRMAGKAPRIRRPTRALTAAEIDPLQSEAGRTLLRKLRKVCLAYPESDEGTQFGSPVWRAGRKAFAVARADGGRVTACFWVGVARQQLMLADARFRIPPYTGHNGWIELDATGGCDAAELAALADNSYRHFALQRMLRLLPQPPPSG